MILLFDAANTLIYKPDLTRIFLKTLFDAGYEIDEEYFHRVHRIISEVYLFPDRTSEEFYFSFNKDVLYGLGIIPNQELLKNLFSNCSYLPWAGFSDTKVLNNLNAKKAVVSNFKKDLGEILSREFQTEFEAILISETEGLRKPDINFYLKVINLLNVAPSEILYIGDSIKLDFDPAMQVGINAWLIDRHNIYPYFKRRIRSLSELPDLLSRLIH